MSSQVLESLASRNPNGHRHWAPKGPWIHWCVQPALESEQLSWSRIKKENHGKVRNLCFFGSLYCDICQTVSGHLAHNTQVRAKSNIHLDELYKLFSVCSDLPEALLSFISTGLGPLFSLHSSMITPFSEMRETWGSIVDIKKHNCHW